MSGQNVTTLGGVAQIMKQTLQAYGLDADALFAKAGVDAPDTIGSQDRVKAVAMQKLWRMAETLTQDQSFGIAYAKHANPMVLHGLGFSWLASDTLRDAFERLVRYYRLISTAGEIILESQAQGYRLWFKIPAPKGVAAPASLDAALALFVQLCRFAKGTDFRPSQVDLQRLPPMDQTPFSEFFGCPVNFDSDENRLHFEADVLDAPLPGANPALARANDQVVIDYLKAFDKQDIISQIRANIIEVLPSGAPSQDQVAEQVHMSTRSMQRKLNERGTSFKAIVEEVRKELATSYLKDTARSIGEVTYLLGFSEPSNFSRSFKKWTGMTPNDFQLQQA